jgi:putative flavoprotein involved in K+ transport
MTRADAIVIGAGQAGLAMSRALAARGVDHLVLERGRVGERWRSERWETLTLLTPDWMNRLPGDADLPGDPDGFMDAPTFARRLDDYAAATGAPVETGAAVLSLDRGPDGFVVRTEAGERHARAVVVATGACDEAFVPAFAAELPDRVAQTTAQAYRRPSDIEGGGVLVVGASSSGLQIAVELAAAGRSVTVAAGAHTRVPRRHRGHDLFWWLDRTGILDERAEDARDIARLRGQPSLQLIGRDGPGRFDLGAAAAAGVRVVGRVLGAAGGRVLLADDLPALMADADRRMFRLLARFDAAARPLGVDVPADGIEPLAPIAGPGALDLAAEGIRTVVWATGYRRRYPWMRLPVLDAAGEIVHRGGITPVPGLYALGLRFMRRRRSNFVAGCGADAEDLAPHLVARLGRTARTAAPTAA